MKSICGVIAEYNPFHRGHAYHLHAAREASGCSHIVTVMSGPFVQRGLPAVLDKFTRARMAAAMGADLVVELPVLCACNHAQAFAAGGVGILHALGADAISFGAEHADESLLRRGASVLAQEPPAMACRIRELLDSGISHPQARARALEEYDPVCAPLLSRSNDILALEYMQAMMRLESRMAIFPISRAGSDYRDDTMQDGALPSATALRRRLAEGEVPWNGLPDELRPLWQEALAAAPPVFPASLDIPLRMAFRSMSPSRLDAMPGAAEGLPRRLAKLAEELPSFAAVTDAAVTRRYSQARVQRTLLQAILGITQADADMDLPGALYAHVLAIGPGGREILGELHHRSRIPIITRPAAFTPAAGPQARLWALDRYASDLYAILQCRPQRQDYAARR